MVAAARMGPRVHRLVPDPSVFEGVSLDVCHCSHYHYYDLRVPTSFSFAVPKAVLEQVSYESFGKFKIGRCERNER